MTCVTTVHEGGGGMCVCEGVELSKETVYMTLYNHASTWQECMHPR